ncbi:TPA: phage tail protein I [Vibrio vulnificus]
MSQSISPSRQFEFTLFTDNASPLERALERAFTRTLEGISPPVPELLHADATPESVLPYLAAERQVPDWSPTDSPVVKRATVQQQKSVFRLCGTISGLDLAVSSLGGESDIKKWYEYEGAPFGLKIISWVKEPPTPETLARVALRLESAKSERDSFSLAVGFKASGSVYVGGAVVSAPRVLVGPWVPPIIEASGAQYVGGAVQSVMRVIVNEYRPD